MPAGVDSGQTLRLAGKGEAGPDGSGDLYVVMTVAPHARFQRIGDDLIVEHEITKALAASGGPTNVPLLHGTREITVPANTQTGDQTVVRGCGIQRVGAPPTPMPSGDDAPYRELDTSGRGNLIVTWKLEEPRRGFLKRLFR